MQLRRSRQPARALWVACLASLFAFFALVAFPSAANAYPWMIRNEEARCANCHTDPSGGGLLTRQGRGASERLLRMHYGEKDQTPKNGDFAFGLIKLPDWLLLGADYRSGFNEMKVDTGKAGKFAGPDYLLMRGDLMAEVRLGWFRASGSVGLALTGAPLDSIVSMRDDGLAILSREHWLGAAFDGDKWLVRAGRINLPFGIRSLEHTTYARVMTRTDIKDGQQHGVAVAYSDGTIRAEVMGIAGNFQIKDDAQRERGYSALFEYAITPKAAVGASSLFTHAKQDITPFFGHVAVSRQAHGVFARWAPAKPVVIMAEADYVGFSPDGQKSWKGGTGLLQVDLEPIPGLHFMPAADIYKPGDGVSAMSWNAWLTTSWFFYSHLDARLDVVHGKQYFGPMTTTQDVILLQIHGWL